MRVLVTFPSGDHQLLPAPSNPPKKDDWDAFRPLVTELYKRHHQTARKIMEVLQLYGFVAT